jgi:class 3 adenylate cyclase
MSPIVIKNGGTIDKFIGDEIMAVFGAPIPKRRHASEAIRTALELRKKAGAILKRHHIKNGGISVGIASGRVISGNIGSDKMTDYTVIGRKVNLASRLTSLAGTNEILVDETTKNASKSHKYKSIGKQNIKGFGNVSVFKVVG